MYGLLNTSKLTRITKPVNPRLDTRESFEQCSTCPRATTQVFSLDLMRSSFRSKLQSSNSRISPSGASAPDVVSAPDKQRDLHMIGSLLNSLPFIGWTVRLYSGSVFSERNSQAHFQSEVIRTQSGRLSRNRRTPSAVMFVPVTPIFFKSVGINWRVPSAGQRFSHNVLFAYNNSNIQHDKSDD